MRSSVKIKLKLISRAPYWVPLTETPKTRGDFSFPPSLWGSGGPIQATDFRSFAAGRRSKD